LSDHTDPRDFATGGTLIVADGMTDEEFIAAGKMANCFLLRLDVRFARLARRASRGARSAATTR
jgi:hypothetical protein